MHETFLTCSWGGYKPVFSPVKSNMLKWHNKSMKLGREVKNSTRESLLNTKKMEMQRTGNTGKCSQRRKKKDKINSYLQKTLKAYRDRRK